MKYTLILILAIFLPIQVLAHGNSYFQFDPDSYKTNSLYVSQNSPVYEIFLPVNEFMGGIDLWFDNAGSSGIAAFNLYDQNNNLLKTTQITIPHINPVAGGQKIHIDWNSQFSVTGSNKYKLKIESSMPQLRIYYADRVGFLSHNAPYTSAYLNGVAEVGGEEKEYSFKFGLLEISETIPPILSNVAIVILSPEEARLDFNSNEPIDFKLDYGSSGGNQTIPFSGSYTVCTQGIATCSITFDVVPNSTYNYTLTGRDFWGNEVAITGTFNSQTLATFTPNPTASNPTPTPLSTQTPAPTPTPNLDITPPVISNLKIVEIRDNGIDVSWETDEATNSNILISFTTDLISIAAASDPTFELVHFISINAELNHSTPYLATVTSFDSSSNVSSANISFMTLGLGQTPVPDPTPISPFNSPTPSPVIVQSSNKETSLDVSWTPSSPSPQTGYRVDIFDANRKLIKTINVDSQTNSLSTSELPEGEKSIIVYTNNDGVYQKVGMPVRAQDPSFTQRLLALWPFLLIVLIMIVGLVVWKIYSSVKAKNPPVPLG